MFHIKSNKAQRLLRLLNGKPATIVNSSFVHASTENSIYTKINLEIKNPYQYQLKSRNQSSPGPDSWHCD